MQWSEQSWSCRGGGSGARWAGPSGAVSKEAKTNRRELSFELARRQQTEEGGREQDWWWRRRKGQHVGRASESKRAEEGLSETRG